MTTGNGIIDKEVKRLEREQLLDTYTTALNKVRLINEVRNSLGVEIKKNPSKVTIHKKSWSQRFKMFLTNIFTKF